MFKEQITSIYGNIEEEDMNTLTDSKTTSTAINVRRMIPSMQSNIIYKMHANVIVIDNTFSNEVEDGVIVLRYIPSIH